MTWPVPPGGYSSAPYYQHYFGSYQEYSPETATLARQSSSPQEGANREFAGFQPETTAQMTYMYTYTLKIINPKRKSEFRVEKFRKGGAFKTPMELRLFIIGNYEELVPSYTEFDIGYYKPSRGSTKVYIKSDTDMQIMYECYKDQCELNIWCVGNSQDDSEEPSVAAATKKRKCDQDVQKSSRRQSIRDEVDEIFMELKGKFESKYTAQQLRLWANMLQVGTWKDRENPPQNPMFGYNGKSHAKTPSLTEALSSVAEGLAHALRPPHHLEIDPLLHLLVHSSMKWVCLQASVHHCVHNTSISLSSFISYWN